MAYKVLNKEEIEELKQMAIVGVAPNDIAGYFGIGIASVHNHKAKLKADGVDIPNVRGQRPKGEIGGVALPLKSDPSRDPSKTFDTNDDSYRFSINGRSVIVTGPVKDIKITPEGLEVNY
ncbi:MAG: hypothetical protein JWP37_29 [Mucilaginibacter sp.]|nr:hypothetical protein [Mucilaginibacter sp.]